MTATGKMNSWERRNPQSREAYLRQNHEQNAARPKQSFFRVPGFVGVWVRG